MERLSRSKNGAHTGPTCSASAASRATTSLWLHRLRVRRQGLLRPRADAERSPGWCHVLAFPVHGRFMFSCGPGWVNPSLAALRPPPVTASLNDLAKTIGDEWETKADLLLLHENFADITHVAVVDPYIAPPVLRSSPPPLEVEVTETTVSFSRTYEPALIPAWQAELPRVAGRRGTRPAGTGRSTPGSSGSTGGTSMWIPNPMTQRSTPSASPTPSRQSLQAEPGTRGGEPKLRAR